MNSGVGGAVLGIESRRSGLDFRVRGFAVRTDVSADVFDSSRDERPLLADPTSFATNEM